MSDANAKGWLTADQMMERTSKLVRTALPGRADRTLARFVKSIMIRARRLGFSSKFEYSGFEGAGERFHLTDGRLKALVDTVVRDQLRREERYNRRRQTLRFVKREMQKERTNNVSETRSESSEAAT